MGCGLEKGRDSRRGRQANVQRALIRAGIRRHDAFELRDQCRDVFLDCLPDDIEVDTEVCVNEPVSHGYHALPINLGRPGPERFGHLARGFTNDFDGFD